MADERCRITVVGERGQVDLAVPARAPIAEYVPMLADLCGPEQSDAMPPALSLAPAGARPYAPDVSLESVGVLDGTTLYLCDVLDGELDGPVVADVGEQIAELEDDGDLWNARTRAGTTLGLGLLIILAAAGTLAARAGTPGAIAAGAPLLAAGLVAALIAWNAGRHRWPVPAPLRLLLAAAACPLLAGATLTLPLPGIAAPVVTASAAASVGALAAYLAAPSVTTIVLQLLCALEMTIAVPVVILHADGVQAAAVVAVVLFAVLGFVPRTAAQVATLTSGREEMEDVALTMRRVQAVLVFLNMVACLLITVCLVVLSTSRDWFALGLVLCLSVALLCRAGSSRLRAVVATVLMSGVAGLVALAVRMPGRITTANVPAWAGPLLILCAGVVVVWAGLVMCFRSSLQKADIDERWRWPGPLAGFLGTLSVPLAFGVFGVFDAILRAGGKM